MSRWTERTDVGGGGFRSQGAALDDPRDSNRGGAAAGDRDALFGGGVRAAPKPAAAAAAPATPIFSLDREDRWRAPGIRLGALRAVASGGGTIVVATNDGHVIRWSAADSSAPPEVIDLRGSRPEGRIHSLFVDPTGTHVIISTVLAGSGINFHVEAGKPAARELASLRGYVIESIGWNYTRPADESRVGPFLVGTHNGRVFEVRLEERKEKTCAKLWELPDGESLPITGLRLEPLGAGPGGATSSGGLPSRYFVLVVTARPQRYYQFTGGPTLEAVFSGGGGGARPLSFNEIRAPLDISAPDVVFAVGGTRFGGSGGAGAKGAAAAAAAAAPGNSTGAPDCFAMLTGVGLLTGRLALPLASSPGPLQGGGGGGEGVSVLADPKMVAYPLPGAAIAALGDGGGAAAPTGSDFDSTSSSAAASSDPEDALPLSLAVTEFHVLLLFRTRLVALSRVTWGVVCETPISPERHGTPRGMVVDTTFGNGGFSTRGAAGGDTEACALWLFTDKALLSVVVTKEDRDVWRLYLRRGDFDSALRFVRGDEAKAELVTQAQAEHLFASGQMDAAAAAFARTSRRPFEELCLKFINAGARSALRRFLLLRLGSLRRREDKLQRTLLATWLTEQYLDGLNSLQPPAAVGTATAPGAASAPAAYEALLGEFRRFLRDTLDALDVPTALNLMAGHGRVGELLYFAALIGDHDRVVGHHVMRGEWRRALWVLRRLAARANAASGGRRAGGPPPAAAERDLDDGEFDDGDLPAPPSAPEPARVAELWYRHSPTLLLHEPAATVASWRGAGRLLDPLRLLPSLVRYEQSAGSSTLRLPLPSVASGGRAPPPVASGTPPSSPSPVLDAALGYLEWAVAAEEVGGLGCTSRGVHNLLLTLLARQPVEALLLDYISLQCADLVPPHVPFSLEPSGVAALVAGPPSSGPSRGSTGGVAAAAASAEAAVAGAGGRLPCFDLPFALRVVLEEGRAAAGTALYAAMGLLGDAVDLALASGRPDLAKRAAAEGLGTTAGAGTAFGGGGGGGSSASSSVAAAALAATHASGGDAALREARRKLWYRIAAWTVRRGGGSAKDALAVLHESDGALRIEDVLGLFPDATLIDDFRGEISESLTECDVAISSLKSEMGELNTAAEKIRGDIRSLRNRCGTLRAGQRCELCGVAALAAPLYLFTCCHAFHRDCLLSEMLGHLHSGARRRVEALLAGDARAGEALQSLEGGGGGGGGGGKGSSAAALPLGFDASAVAALLGGGVPSNPTELRRALQARKEELSGELDRIVAGQCLFCGDIMIDSVATPFSAGAGMVGGGDAEGGKGGGGGGGGSGALAEDVDWAV